MRVRLAGALLLAAGCPWTHAQSPAPEEGPERIALQLDDSASIELVARWEPLTDTVYQFEQRFDMLKDLRPAEEQAAYGAEHFRPLLPDQPVALGETWALDPKDLLPFLRQLHPGATEQLHHSRIGGKLVRGSAEGAWALLRAWGPDQAEVLLRVHAEFLLESDGEGRASWLTPAQFEGRLVIDRRPGTVRSFELALPDQSANVDLNISKGDMGMADIGRIPRMELRGGESGALPAEHAMELPLARLELARKFYPAAHVNWKSLEDALAESRATGKPLHVLLLFGSLMDESC